MAGYRVITRKDTGTFWIVGPDPRGGRYRRAAKAVSRKQAAAEAAHLFDDHLRESWHGPKRGDHSFAEAVLSYLEAKPRRHAEISRLERLVGRIGEETGLSTIDQDTVTRIGTGRPPSWVQREVITPLRAVLRHAARRKWCDVPIFESQPQPAGRVLFLLPEEAERLVLAAAPHLRPLLQFLLGTGARLSEALELQWRDVDLSGGRVIFWRTKNGKRRVAMLPARVMAVLGQMQKREGQVFNDWGGKPYADQNRERGGQIRNAWIDACQEAGIDLAITPHCLRHTWASWHYALHHDLLKLKDEGGWSSVMMVERYAHLMPEGHGRKIRQWLGSDTRLRVVGAR